MSEGMNNNEKWKSLWQPMFNNCFDESNVYILILMLFTLKELLYRLIQS